MRKFIIPIFLLAFGMTACRKAIVNYKPVFEQARKTAALDSSSALAMVDNDRYIRKYRSCYWNDNVEQPQPQLMVDLTWNGNQGSYAIYGSVDEDSTTYRGTFTLYQTPQGWHLRTNPETVILQGIIKSFGDHLFLENLHTNGCDNYLERR